MKNTARATGIAGLVLLVSMGLGACSSAAPTVNPSSPNVAASPSVDAAKTAVVSEVNAFFADISKETKPFVADRKADPSAYSKLSKDEQIEKVRAAFKDSFSHIDEPAMGTEKPLLLIGGFANTMDHAPGSILTVEPSGVTVDGDEARIDGSHLKLAVGSREQISGDANSPGNFNLKHTATGWKIVDFKAKESPASPAPSEPAK